MEKFNLRSFVRVTKINDGLTLFLITLSAGKRKAPLNNLQITQEGCLLYSAKKKGRQNQCAMTFLMKPVFMIFCFK